MYLRVSVCQIHETDSVKTSASGKAVKLSTVNQAWKIKVNIHKTSSTNNANLPGAEFTIYQWNGEKYTKYKTQYAGFGATAILGDVPSSLCLPDP